MSIYIKDSTCVILVTRLQKKILRKCLFVELKRADSKQHGRSTKIATAHAGRAGRATYSVETGGTGQQDYGVEMTLAFLCIPQVDDFLQDFRQKSLIIGEAKPHTIALASLRVATNRASTGRIKYGQCLQNIKDLIQQRLL